MEESDRLRTSQKAYRVHVTRILLNKVEATLDTEIDELALTFFKNGHCPVREEKRADCHA